MLNVLTDFLFPPAFRAGGEDWQTRKTSRFSASEILSADLVVTNQDAKVALLAKALGRKAIVVDLVLRPPTSEAKRRLMKLAFSRVDYFIHYFRDLRGYERFYGIGPERSGYAAFKPNLRGKFTAPLDEGTYITIFGQSCRDYDTYFAATKGLDAVMPSRDLALLRKHGSIISGVPGDVRVLPDDGSQTDVARILAGAKLVVIPVWKDNICASSIGTYLNAMWLGRPCVLTAGPGVSDVLTDQALIVPPGDPLALREAIETLLGDDQLRRDLAERGRRYADSLGGVVELSLRVRDEAMRWWYSRGKTHPGEQGTRRVPDPGADGVRPL